MKLRNKITWIPIVGLITGFLYGMDEDSPVQTHTKTNAFMHGIIFCCMLLYFSSINTCK